MDKLNLTIRNPVCQETLQRNFIIVVMCIKIYVGYNVREEAICGLPKKKEKVFGGVHVCYLLFVTFEILSLPTRAKIVLLRI